jgi:starch-binding outer membrane protein, SusD/RagB family
MKRYIQRMAAVTCVLLGLAACDDSVLDVTPPNEVPDELVFTDLNLAEAYLNDIYVGLGHGLYEIMMSSITDETHFIHNYDTEPIVQSLITSSFRAALGDWRMDHYDWSDNYSRIRQANIFLEQIDEAEFDEDSKQRMKGEAHFLRAYFYHNLMRMYGGVPLVTQIYGLDEDYEVERASFEETIDFIVADAEAAAELLPLSHEADNVGRATQGAALALRARVRLYAASDLYNENPTGEPETGYTSGQDRAALWRAAKDAAQDVIDLGIYGLFRGDPAPGDSTAQNYGDLFLQRSSDEAIFSRFFLVTRDDGYDPGLHNGPNGYHLWGGNTPIQNLIDDYRMADGSKFDWDNPEHAAAPYENRDPRFYASILYDGAPWVQRPDDVRELDPNGIVQTFRQLQLPDGAVAGLDTRDSPIEDWNGAYSGYYLRKFIDPSVNHQFTKQEIPWIFFRYAEILLNYAEASLELGEIEDALDALNQIRRRAGMPELDAGMSLAELEEEYRNERRVEMAFEEQRFFDVRRWMIAPEVLSRNAGGISIFLEGDSRTDPDTWRNYRYETRTIQPRDWHDRLYFMPIGRDELNRNSLLRENPGY